MIYVLNGPNPNLLGKRQPHLYGDETLANVEADCRELATELGHDICFQQSNCEDELIDWIHEARATNVGIVINAGAYTPTSLAILDALNAFEGPVIEVHNTHVRKRESYRQHSFLSQRAHGVIAGLGTNGYPLAIRHIDTLAQSG